jgi:hypothetical protein
MYNSVSIVIIVHPNPAIINAAANLVPEPYASFHSDGNSRSPTTIDNIEEIANGIKVRAERANIRDFVVILKMNLNGSVISGV